MCFDPFQSHINPMRQVLLLVSFCRWANLDSGIQHQISALAKMSATNIQSIVTAHTTEAQPWRNLGKSILPRRRGLIACRNRNPISTWQDSSQHPWNSWARYKYSGKESSKNQNLSSKREMGHLEKFPEREIRRTTVGMHCKYDGSE